MNNTVDIRCMNIENPAWMQNLADFARQVLDDLDEQGWELSLLMCDAAFIRELNASYRGKDEATDVLSFSQDGLPLEDAVRGGDIVISLPTVQRYAADFGAPEEEELKRVVIHGILHLQGKDHETNDRGEPMLEEQERLILNYSGVKVF